jgi:FkbM family methyltransferase
MLGKLKKTIKQFLKPDLKFRFTKLPECLQKLGTPYGGWTVPISLVNENSVCYLAGAGEDISFDVELATRFHCSVHIFDPTPRAKEHFDNVVNSFHVAVMCTPEGNLDYEYDLDDEAVHCLHFHQLGIWTKNEVLRFFAPKDEAHVSHSISNMQGTENYFEAPVRRLSDIMKEQGHTALDILKLDIEGAEYEVLDTVLADGLAIKVLCVEFHPSKELGLQPVQAMISKLEQNKYKVIAREDLDFTFINYNLYQPGTDKAR